MKLALLNPSYEDSKSPFAAHDPLCDPSVWLPDHDWHRVLIHKQTAVQQVRGLQRQGFDCIVNLCDGGFDEDRPGIEVVHALERYDLPFTGANTPFYEPSRDVMKRVCHAWDIETADFVFASDDGDLARAAETLRFPVIVKHPSSYGSIGMGKDARCVDAAALMPVARRMIASFGGALIEEFVEGREFTVLVSENADDPRSPHSYIPVECRFPPGETFKHFDLKWVDFEGMAWVPVDDDALSKRLRDMATRMFLGCRGVGYGRCDIRMAPDGRLVMLEINPNCGIFYPKSVWGSADIILSHDSVGHAGFIRRILDAAMRRHAAARPIVHVRKQPGGGYGLVAARPIATGEVVQPGEERPQVLVTREKAATWPARERSWFDRYAWPIGPDTFVMWHDDPALWMPINHSCDPNTVMRGLDLVARRPIPTNEPVTADYSTFCGDGMEPFECRCGSGDCRSTIRGNDYQLPALIARYGNAVSPWILSRRGKIRE